VLGTISPSPRGPWPAGMGQLQPNSVPLYRPPHSTGGNCDFSQQTPRGNLSIHLKMAFFHTRGILPKIGLLKAYWLTPLTLFR